MKNQNRLLVLFISWAILWLNCANPITPEGGPRDKRSPQIDTTASSPFLATNFDEKRIVIAFDEWVKLNNASQQIIISPPPKETPEIKIKGKSVIIEFQEKLRENTTYTITFGEAVEDITERNKARNLRYVFSTGAYLDSLQLRGRVRDTKEQRPIEGALVMLHENLEDSVVYLEQPFYVTRTNSSGDFEIKNLKAGTYKALALVDDNLNYKFDGGTEKIAFLDSNLVLTDSFRQKINFEVFEEAQAQKLTYANATQYGRVRFQLNQNAQKIRLQHLTTDRNFNAFAEVNADSVIYWFDANDSIAEAQFVLSDALDLRDTVTVKIPSKTDFLKQKPRLQLLFRSNATASNLGLGGDAKAKYEAAIFSDKLREITPTKPIKIEFNHPIYEVKTNDIILLEDSLKKAVQPRLKVEKNDRRTLIVEYDWLEDTSYELLIPVEALTDIFGFANDSIRLPYRVKKLSDYGNLDVIIDSLEKDKNYLIELTDLSLNILEKFSISGGTSFEYRFEMLLPEQYILRVIEDDNANGKWDSGNYLAQRKPEKIYTKSITEMRADWDLEVDMQLKDAAPVSRGTLDRAGTIRDRATERPSGAPSLNKGKN